MAHSPSIFEHLQLGISIADDGDDDEGNGALNSAFTSMSTISLHCVIMLTFVNLPKIAHNLSGDIFDRIY